MTDFTAGDGSTLVRAMDAALGDRTPGGSTQNKTPASVSATRSSTPGAQRSTLNTTVSDRTLSTPGGDRTVSHGDRTMTPGGAGADKTTVTPATAAQPVDDDETQDPNADMEGTLFRFTCGSPPGVIVADTLSFNAKMDLVDF